MFGVHLLLDCYDCNKNKLKDLKFVLKFLGELPKIIGMNKIAEPYAVSYPGNPKTFDRGGVSAVVLIAESHISIHTFPSYNYMNVDIFSCKEFDTDRAADIIIKAFEAKKFEKNVLDRGLEFPKQIPKAIEIVKNQRKRIKV